MSIMKIKIICYFKFVIYNFGTWVSQPPMNYHPLFVAFLNTVYILTDDQDVKLNSLEVQPAVHSLLIEQGLFFNNAFVTTPVCCPSRYVYIDIPYIQLIVPLSVEMELC